MTPHPLHTALRLALLLGALALSTPAARAAPGDRDLAAEVEDALAADPHLDHAPLEVVVDGGVVTLRGDVDTLLARERALALAHGTEGVRGVVDALELAPHAAPADHDLALAIHEALRLDPALEPARLEVAVSGGAVALGGDVDSWQEAQLAVRRVKGVRGVRQVADALRIVRPERRPDPEIAAEIAQTLAWDVLLDARDVEVAVNRGRVSLSGHVASAAEKNRAVLAAWTTGVRAVDAAALELDPSRAARRHTPSAADAALAQAVRDALHAEPQVFSVLVGVDVHDGIATLHGQVPTLLARRAAEVAAGHTAGILQVDSQLEVAPLEPLPDATLRHVLHLAYALDPRIDADAVQIRVERGVITLEGTVESFSARTRAEALAASLRGAVEIVDRLAVRQDDTPLVVSPTRETAWLWAR